VIAERTIQLSLTFENRQLLPLGSLEDDMKLQDKYTGEVFEYSDQPLSLGEAYLLLSKDFVCAHCGFPLRLFLFLTMDRRQAVINFSHACPVAFLDRGKEEFDAEDEVTQRRGDCLPCLSAASTMEAQE